MKGLTLKQQQVFAFIKQFIETYDYAPSYNEIKSHFCFGSLGTVYKYIQILQRKGALTAEKNCSRSLFPISPTLISAPPSQIELPLIGTITAGFPLDLFMQPQQATVPLMLVHNPESTYILKAQGDSFNEELIADGDFLIIEARQEAQAGERALVLINNHDTFIKKYYPEEQYIRLESHNAQSKPLTLRQDSVLVQGILIGIMRTY